VSELYAITVRLPWAAAIRDGEKLVENRGRMVAAEHVGRRVAIHTGSVWDAAAVTDPRLRRWWYGHEAQRSLSGSEFRGLFGKVLAVATLVGCHEAKWPALEPRGNCCAPWGDAFYGPPRQGGRPVAKHLVLADVVALVEPVETRGYLPVPWLMPADVARRVLDQVPGVSGV